MMCTKGTLMLILNVFVFVFVISSQSTAGKRDFMCYPLHKFYMLTRHPLNCIIARKEVKVSSRSGLNKSLT